MKLEILEHIPMDYKNYKTKKNVDDIGSDKWLFWMFRLSVKCIPCNKALTLWLSCQSFVIFTFWKTKILSPYFVCKSSSSKLLSVVK